MRPSRMTFSPGGGAEELTPSAFAAAGIDDEGDGVNLDTLLEEEDDDLAVDPTRARRTMTVEAEIAMAASEALKAGYNTSDMPTEADLRGIVGQVTALVRRTVRMQCAAHEDASSGGNNRKLNRKARLEMLRQEEAESSRQASIPMALGGVCGFGFGTGPSTAAATIDVGAAFAQAFGGVHQDTPVDTPVIPEPLLAAGHLDVGAACHSQAQAGINVKNADLAAARKSVLFTGNQSNTQSIFVCSHTLKAITLGQPSSQ